MRRGSTPKNTFDVDIDLTGATVIVSYEQNGNIVLEKTGDDLTVTQDSITLSLSQEDTLKFRTGEVYIQIRYVFPEGSADASDIIRTTFERIIHDGVIEP